MSVCAVVAASDFNADHFKSLDDQGFFDEVYAVDGGWAHLVSLGRKADMALGDFDSLGYVPDCARVSKHPVMKDQSDLELALERVKTRRYSEVFVYGALGGRLDHTLANLQLFARFAEEGMDVVAIDLGSALRVLVGPDAFDLPNLPSGTVSVFSASDEAHGVIERGLRYAFNDETLTNRTSRGLSNELTGKPAMVGLEKGSIFVFYPLG
ncbi:MAG: thiamine diphosphokinase [Berryella intestinalis]|uniref:thiamine diphosphokinase n=1 Tax=Berryella intestinalis TaxID=1531429 RepID=UPI002A504DBE|nr:thiamine diphosphokinase [Berryella intestinalis]MDD7368431.1 thiamine diphosphokinase [Berryella intestinalis]MDY3128516.1 thiamine diphosphokinase [Berryella intestinalis]